MKLLHLNSRFKKTLVVNDRPELEILKTAFVKKKHLPE